MCNATRSQHARTAVAVLGALCLLMGLALASNPATASAKSVVAKRLDALRDAGQITEKVHRARLTDYNEARRVRKKRSGASRVAMAYVIKVAERLARDGRLTADRVDPVFLILKRNAAWFDKGNGPAAYGARRRFGSSRIYFQYFPGRGWQIHPLANFSKLNAVWTDKSTRARRALGEYARELIGISVQRAGFMSWEYYFTFEGGRPPWISSISQGTAIQALARSGNSLNDAELTAAAKDALGAFETGAPTGVKVNSEGGSHYLIYPFKRRFHVLNAFVQSLIGLNDYYEHSGDKKGLELRNDGLRTAKIETQKSDTGAWSLYSVGGRESTLTYHRLLRDFLGNICDRIDSDVFCDANKSFTAYLGRDPSLTKLKARVRRGRVIVAFTLSKISSVTLRGAGTGSSRATASRGRRSFSVKKPSKSGTYTMVVSATDLAGNSASKRVRVKVRK